MSVLGMAVVAACAREGDVPCDGEFRPDLGELCDDGNSSDGDGCDCATRGISLAPSPMSTSAPQVVVEDGAWCWFQDERVIADQDGAGHERLVIASMSHGGDVQVSSLLLDSGDRTLAHLQTRMERDDHDTPSLLPLADGRIAAYFTRHDGFPYLYTQFTEHDGDVTAWSRKSRGEFYYDVTYTNPFVLAENPHELLMFIRGVDTSPTLLFSSDDGRSWSDGTQLLAVGERGYDGRVFDHRPYVKYASDGEKVHLFYTDGHPAEFRRNSIHHLIYRNRALYQSDNTTKVASAGPDNQPQLDPGRGTLVYDGAAQPGGQAWTWDAAVDAVGNPVTVFSTFPDPDPARWFYDHQYRYATWSNGAWHVRTIAYAGTGIYQAEGFYSGGIALDPDDPRIVYFASNVDPVTGAQTASGVFEIYRGITNDDGATWSITAITSGSRVSNLR
ncbi:MAG TPA: BNR-4 repeat-containing protein, partial [Kofleriaceae bacterium]|nr:BNR-4 repeat-containing protein [Kofleriaceae bacterium]